MAKAEAPTHQPHPPLTTPMPPTPNQNPDLARANPEPRQSVEDITRLMQQARTPGVAQAVDLDPEVELDGMEAEEELMANGGSGANYAV